MEQAKTIVRSVKEHHLFAKAKEEKQQILARIIEETKHLTEQTTQVVKSIPQIE